MNGNEAKKGPRARTLEAASRLFYEQGFLNTGVNQVIDEAGVAKASFYDHFDSKEDLAVAYLEVRHNEWMTRLEEAVREYDDPEERLLAPFEFLERWVGETSFRGCAFLNMVSEFPEADHPVRERARNHKAILRKTFRDLTRKAFPDSKEDMIDQVADSLYLLFEGAIVESQNFGESWPARSARTSARKRIERAS